jgi:hypothetical protein
MARNGAVVLSRARESLVEASVLFPLNIPFSAALIRSDIAD